MKVKKGDKVKVIAGNFKGTEALITKVLTKKSRVVVEGVNVKKKTLKTRGSENTENFVYVPHSVHVSNVVKVSNENSEGAQEKPTKKTTAKSNSKKRAAKA